MCPKHEIGSKEQFNHKNRRQLKSSWSSFSGRVSLPGSVSLPTMRRYLRHSDAVNLQGDIPSELDNLILALLPMNICSEGIALFYPFRKGPGSAACRRKFQGLRCTLVSDSSAYD